METMKEKEYKIKGTKKKVTSDIIWKIKGSRKTRTS